MKKSLALTGCMVLLLGLSACGDDERVTELEGQLSDAQSQNDELNQQIQTAQGETDGLRQQLDEANAKVTQMEDAAAQGGSAPDAEALRGPMQSAVGSLKQVDEQLVQLRQSLPVQKENMAPIDELRAHIADAGRSMGEVAQAVGIDPNSLAESQN